VLKELVKGLPGDLDASVFIVLHIGASDPSHLATILRSHSILPVTQAEDGESVRRGHVYVARPDYHLILEAKTVHLARGPRENRCRPAIDALFRSAAYVHGSRTIGVVLSGTLDDGTAGLWWIKKRGGVTVVQDPSDAEFPSMPQNALRHVAADHVLPSASIGRLLGRLSEQAARSEEEPASQELEVEAVITKEGRALQAGVMDLGPITPYTCPECHGALVQLKEGGIPRFRCHTGHAYSINTLLAEVTEYVEGTLWASIRAIEESAMLLKHIGRHIASEGQEPATIRLFEEKAGDTLKRADAIREVVQAHQTLSQDNVTEVQRRSR
jgi:two-component system chemotaxis response regulator CheB